MTLETIWTPALETAATKAQQHPATPKVRRPVAIDLVAAYLDDHPGASMRGIHDGTGLSLQDVNSAIFLLLKQGRILRSHRQQDDRSRPVEWRLRG